jgi:hypothetical protein
LDVAGTWKNAGYPIVMMDVRRKAIAAMRNPWTSASVSSRQFMKYNSSILYLNLTKLIFLQQV